MDMNEGSERNALNLVQEGMSVYDVQDEKVGVVKELFLGEMSGTDKPGNADRVKDSLPVAPEATRQLGAAYLAVDLDESLPREARAWLRREGYVRIKAIGLLQPDHYATADQIAHVSGNRVYLRVRRGNLLTD